MMKVAVITGAASGIGRALTLACLQRGLTVVMVDKDHSKLNIEANRLMHEFPNRLHALTCDVTKADEVDALAKAVFEKVREVHWLYNNAGIIGSLGPIWELTHDQIQHVMEVNLYGAIHMIKAFMPYLFEQQSPSHIVNMASLYALCAGSQLAPYTMSKHALLALSESLYFDLKRLEKPIHVSVVFPSFTDTSLLSHPETSETNSFQSSLSSLLSHSRPALEVAEHIVQKVAEKQFYILPDKEVKGYCEDRSKAIVLQEHPHVNNVEQLLEALMSRKRKKQ